MPRLDRFATIYFFSVLRSHIFPRNPGIPILMYHSISHSAERRVHPYYWTTTTPAVFDEHMRFLHQRNYTSITLEEAAKRIASPNAKHGKAVVLTFDDGYEDFYTNAFPILSRYGLGATVFLPTGYIGESSRQFNGSDCLTWSEVKELKRSGIEFGSHTVTHPQLRALAPEAIRHELRCSKETIEDNLNCPVSSFAYPYALPEADHAFKDSLHKILAETGYKTGVSTIIGTLNRSSDKFFMKRLPVNSADDQRFFAAKLAGGYEWLHPVQYARKAAGRILRTESA